MRVLLLVPALLMLVLSGSCGRSSAGLVVIPIEIEGHKLKAEVAVSASEQSRGLMYRRELGRNAAMLFVYEDEETLSFWMKNTFVPLSIAWIDADGLIVGIDDMQPQTRTPHRSPRPAQYALEVNLGWFAERGIEPGAKATFELPDE